MKTRSIYIYLLLILSLMLFSPKVALCGSVTANNDFAEVTEDTDLTAVGNLLDNDEDTNPNHELSVIEVNGNAGDVGNAVAGSYGDVTINTDGGFTYNLNNAHADVQALGVGETLTETFQYTASDIDTNTDTAILTVTINGNNDDPVLDSAIPDQNNEDADVVSLDVSGHFSDPDGDTLTFSVTAGSLPTGLSINGTTGVISGTVDKAASQNSPFNPTITADDGNGGTVNDSFTWNITNPPPVLDSAIPDQNNEDADVVSLDVSGHFSDPDGDTLTFSVTAGSLPTGLSINGTTGVISGTVDKAASQNSPFNPTITADDGNGGTVNDSFTWHITNPPPVSSDDTAEVTEDTATTASGNVLDNDSDPDGDDLSVIEVNGVAGNVGNAVAGSYGSVTINADGGFTYNLNNAHADVQALGVGETLTDAFQYAASDGEGGTDTAALIVTIHGNNDDPVAVADFFSTDEKTGITGNILTNDYDPDTNDILVVDSFDSSGTTGLVSVSSDGTLTYDPNGQFDYLAEGESANDTFTYTVSDQKGGSDTATVTITINGMNDPPTVLTNTGMTIYENDLGMVIGSDKLAATDPDDVDDDLVFTFQVKPNRGSLFNGAAELDSGDIFTQTDINSGNISYDHDGSDTTSDSFGFTIKDSKDAETGQETFSITIIPSYNLTLSVSGDGAINADPSDGVDCGSACTEYRSETPVTLTPIPGGGHAFSNWTGSISGTSNPYVLTMDGDKNITAQFSANEDCVDVDQRYNSGQWNLLGTFYFAEGDGAWVTLTRIHDGDEGSSTCADAIRFSPAGGGSDVIVDNGDAEYSETGSWSNSSGPNYYGTQSRYTDTNGSTATWRPTIPVGEGGEYSVYAWWTTAGTRDSSATYCIHNYDGHSIEATRGGNGTLEYTIDGGATQTLDIGSTRFPVGTGSEIIFTFEADDNYIIDYVYVDGEILTELAGEKGPKTYPFESMAMDHSIEVGFSVGEENMSCIPVDQQESGYSWTSLGTFRFPGGDGAYVTLTHKGDGTVSHDAVKFSPVGGGADIIIDDLDAGSVFSQLGGGNDWESREDNNCYNGNYHFTNLEGASVEIRPNLPAAGEYEIWVRWRAYSTRDRTAQYCVHDHMGRIILATAGANGVLFAVDPDSGETVATVESNTSQVINVLTGSNLKLVAEPDEGYVNQEFIVDGVPSGIMGSYLFTNIQSSRSIEAYFNDHGDTCDYATPIDCGSSTEGTITPAGDADYFKIEFAGSGRYTFYTEGDTDTKGRLLDTFCTPITTDDDSGEATNFNISEDLDAGTYYIEVTHADPDNGTGDYTLNILCEHVIRATARSGGAIAPEGEIVVSRGSDMSFTIEPDSGNTIYQVKVDGVPVGDVSTYSFVNITGNHTIEAIFSLPPGTCNDISDVPLDALTRGAPPIIMFAMDDSGSMDWEFMTPEEDGLFANKYFVFDNPGDNVYSNTRILSGDLRSRWKSQWAGYNEIYYNPSTVYVPWPTLPDADLVTPRSHPYRTGYTFNLDNTYKTVELSIVVDNTGTYDGDEKFTDDGTGGEFTASNKLWYPSGSGGYYGPNPPRSMNSNTSGATASWTPELPASGEYEVFVWHTAYSTRDAEAPYQIVHNGGVSWKKLDQQNEGGQWRSLGTYNFNMEGNAAGPSGVTLFRCDDGLSVWDVYPSADPSQETSGWTDHNNTTNADAVKFLPTTGGTLNVRNAHYYVLADDNGNGNYDSGETVYLVNLNHDTQAMEYYQVLTESDTIGDGLLRPVAEYEVADSARPRNPNGNYRTYLEERQNFANWYSFYRRRQHTSIAAISRTIYDLDNALVGFRSINGDIKQPVLPVRVDGANEVSSLLGVLYEYQQVQRNTPLRNGLKYVGQYLDQTDSAHGDLGSTSPWYGQGEGGECQQAFAILMTDGFWNGPSPEVGNVDGDQGSPYADTHYNTVADVAMYYYLKDLDSDLDNEVPINPYDNATHQHMVTYGVSFGVSGTLDPKDYDIRSTNPEDHPTWPNPGAWGANLEKIDDLWHASVNGRGEFLSASNPDQLIQSLLDIMQSIQERDGSASSVSINGDQLFGVLDEDTRVFQALYNSGTMSGDVKSFPIAQQPEDPEVDPPVGTVLIDDPVWSAAELLDQKVNTSGHESRIIITRSLTPGGNGIPFTHSAISQSGTTKQLEYLTPDWSASAAASTENLINYLRGEQAYEERSAGPFRDRINPEGGPGGRLGDIVHSSPIFHNNMLYVGANDGMLHALDAKTGQELFAYVPGLVYENLKEYGDPAYRHKFYVDQTPNVNSRVDFSGTQKAVLVGGLGKGGKGYYALDITGFSGATSFAGMTEADMAARVLWEFPDFGAAGDIVDNMGYSYSRTSITRTNDTDNAPWVVIFGNGYNSENSSAVLFILDATDGSLVKQIDTGVTNCNGLSSPARVDVDFDGKVDYVYAGDLQGNLWKFDLTSSDYNDWDVAYADSSQAPQPLFQARGPYDSPQPITTRPDVMYHCGYPALPGFMIIFGTGKYLGVSDLQDSSTQSIYGIWDYGDDEDPSEYLGAFMRGQTPQLSNQLDSVSLLEQTVSEYTLTIDAEEMTFRVLSSNTPYWSVTTTPDDGTTCGDFPESNFFCDPNGIGTSPDPLAHAGWYVDFHEPGERSINDPIIRLGILSYITFVPKQDDPCDSGGISFPFYADPCTGGNLGRPVFDINNDGVIDEQDLINIGTEANPILMAPSARMFGKRLLNPAILDVRESPYAVRLYPGADSSIASELTDETGTGIIYWKDMTQE